MNVLIGLLVRIVNTPWRLRVMVSCTIIMVVNWGESSIALSIS